MPRLAPWQKLGAGRSTVAHCLPGRREGRMWSNLVVSVGPDGGAGAREEGCMGPLHGTVAPQRYRAVQPCPRCATAGLYPHVCLPLSPSSLLPARPFACCSVGSVFFYAMSLSFALILLHGGFREPDNLFVDEGEVRNDGWEPGWDGVGEGEGVHATANECWTLRPHGPVRGRPHGVCLLHNRSPNGPRGCWREESSSRVAGAPGGADRVASEGNSLPPQHMNPPPQTHTFMQPGWALTPGGRPWSNCWSSAVPFLARAGPRAGPCAMQAELDLLAAAAGQSERSACPNRSSSACTATGPAPGAALAREGGLGPSNGRGVQRPGV